MIPKNNCLDCGKMLWDDYHDKSHREGMICICVFCGFLMKLDKSLNLIVLPDNEITPDVKFKSDFAKIVNKIKPGIIQEVLSEQIEKTREKFND